MLFYDDGVYGPGKHVGWEYNDCGEMDVQFPTIKRELDDMVARKDKFGS